MLRHLGQRGRIALGAVAGVALLAASAVAVARVAFEREIAGEIDDLFTARAANPPSVVTEADLAGLPEPVQRWLRASGVIGKERPSIVRLKYEGDFRLSEDKSWMPYQSETYYTTDPPAFLWRVKMEMFPLVSIVGRDRYCDGDGGIRMRLLGFIPVADKAGGALNQGSLLRYLGETVWFPAAVLSPHITWEPIDAHAARATMTYRGVSGSLTFFFDADGRVVRQEAADRYNDARGGPERWSIPITAWGQFGNVRVPTEGEGVWNYDTGDFTYIRWRVTDVEYDRAERY